MSFDGFIPKLIYDIIYSNEPTLNSVLLKNKLLSSRKDTDIILFNLNDYVPEYDNEHVVILSLTTIDNHNDTCSYLATCEEDNISVYEAKETYLKLEV